MLKQKWFKKLHHFDHDELMNCLAAWMFMAAVLLGTVEVARQPVLAEPTGQTHHLFGDENGSAMVARGEGQKESARLPEEYDIGLRATSISGS